LGDSETGQKSKLALLDILLQASIDEDIRQELNVFIFAGDDTTTSGLSHALHVLSRYPEVQDRVYKEILGVLGEDPDSPVTQSQLLDLKYLDCVIKETMRLHPPVPIIGRYIPNDLQIPGNTNIFLMPYYVLRDPEYFPDPQTFKPERWMDGENALLPNFAYIPFSAGPKNCMGQKFANLQLKTLIRHFELLILGKELKAIIHLY
uniref:Probable cytochrome P450 4d21 n=1 Tax=Drosophila rhopaloa TaxID=1041015 RepID=A0A6P4EB37_DRORH